MSSEEEKSEAQYPTPSQIFALSYLYYEELKQRQKEEILDRQRLTRHQSSSSVLPHPLSVTVRHLSNILPSSMNSEMLTNEEFYNQLNFLVEGGLLEQEFKDRTGEYASFSITANGMLFINRHIVQLSRAIKKTKKLTSKT
jgi:hypothetical protein